MYKRKRFSPKYRARKNVFKRRKAGYSNQYYGSGVTTQHDRSSQYQYKPLAKYKKNKYIKRYRAFEKMLDSNLATQTVVRNGTVSASVTGTTQGYLAAHMYGLAGISSGAAETGVDDLWQIFSNDLGTVERGTKLQFTNAILDVTMRNSGSNTIECDVYQYKLKKSGQIEAFSSLSNMIFDAEGDTTGIGLGASLVMTNRGATPFEFPLLCNKVKILKKTKYLIAAGQAVTYQLKNRSTYNIMSDVVLDYTPGLITKWNFWATEGVFIIIKSITGTSDCSMDIGATRTYRYVKKELSKVRDAAV